MNSSNWSQAVSERYGQKFGLEAHVGVDSKEGAVHP